MLSGTALVPRGQAAGEVVVFHGRALVLGVAVGDVIVLDGPVTVSGQVSGSVIAINGPIRVSASASIRGDVLGGDTVQVADGATIEGDVRESVSFTPRDALSVLGGLLGPLAIAVSVLVLGLALLTIVPRGADRVATAARSAPLTSIGWGVVAVIVLPMVGAALSVTLVALPIGLALLLGLAFAVPGRCDVGGVLARPRPGARSSVPLAGVLRRGGRSPRRSVSFPTSTSRRGSLRGSSGWAR